MPTSYGKTLAPVSAASGYSKTVFPPAISTLRRPSRSNIRTSGRHRRTCRRPGEGQRRSYTLRFRRDIPAIIPSDPELTDKSDVSRQPVTLRVRSDHDAGHIAKCARIESWCRPNAIGKVSVPRAMAICSIPRGVRLRSGKTLASNRFSEVYCPPFCRCKSLYFRYLHPAGLELATL